MVLSTAVGTVLSWLTSLPLAMKWQLGVRRVAAAVGALGVLSGGLVSLVPAGRRVRPGRAGVAVWVLTMVQAAAVLAYRFLRDPERQVPSGDALVVSPAEGTVLYVTHCEAGEVPVSDKHGRRYRLEELTRTPLRSANALVIGVAMSFLDVHVNRAPVAGRVTLRRHFRGDFGSLRDPDMIFKNECATTVIEGADDLQIAVVQIASRLVRQIVSFVDEGQTVALGQRTGVIRFGSQVDVVLPTAAVDKVLVKEGDHVRAGESVLATIKRRGGSGRDTEAHAGSATMKSPERR